MKKVRERITTEHRKTRAATWLLALAVVACGGGSGKEQAETESAPAEAPPSVVSPTPAAEEGATTEPASGKAAPAVTSLDEGPIDAGQLRDAYFHWQGEEVTVVGYPAQLFASTSWNQRLSLGAEPEPKAVALLECEMAEVPEGSTESAQAIVVRGTFQRRWYPSDPPRLELSGCRFVETADSVPAAGDPWVLDGNPIPIPVLHDAAFGWQGETVRVVGRWVGTTTSRLKAGDITRHDLEGAADTEPAVGCEQAGETRLPESAQSRRYGLVVEGTIGESYPGKVILDDCRLVESA